VRYKPPFRVNEASGTWKKIKRIFLFQRENNRALRKDQCQLAHKVMCFLGYPGGRKWSAGNISNSNRIHLFCWEIFAVVVAVLPRHGQRINFPPHACHDATGLATRRGPLGQGWDAQRLTAIKVVVVVLQHYFAHLGDAIPSRFKMPGTRPVFHTPHIWILIGPFQQSLYDLRFRL